MTNTTKMTNKKALTYAIEHLVDAPADVVEKLEAMIAALDRKNASPKKLTAQQAKNEGLRAIIGDFLADNAPTGFTCSDLIKHIPALEGDNSQHVSALMRALILDGTAEKYIDKRRTYFRKAEG